MSHKAVQHVWKHAKARGMARLVLVALADHCNGKRDSLEAWPSLKVLAAETKLTIRTVCRNLAELEAVGDIQRKRSKAKKVAAERAHERIEAEVDKVMDEYLRLAKGGKAKKGSSPQTIRHCAERWLPPARHGVDISVDSPEEFYRALEAARRMEVETQTPTIDVPRA
jgi:DNA-binding transcriptional regulator YhcF (GntR family)